MKEKNKNKDKNSDINIAFNKAKFIISAADLKQLPHDTGAEVAFIGRSNAGKSSALNTLCNQKNLAKTSKTPGRTQLINVFDLNTLDLETQENKNFRLIDLPGYGFAKVPDKTKKNWQVLLDKYLRQRASLKALVIVMDIRHPLQNLDWDFLYWTEDCNINTHILLTKADKFSFGKQKTVLLTVKKEIKDLKNSVTVQVFSATNRIGVDELENSISNFLLS